MAREVRVVLLLCAISMSLSAGAQTANLTLCPYYPQHQTSLACLIPDVTQTGQSQNLSRFNTTIAQVLSQLPLAAPVSGFVVGLDKATGQFVPISENLGSVLTERGNTVGKYKLFIGFTAQRFVFSTIDGTSLSSLPSVYQISTTPAASAGTAPTTFTTAYGSSANFMSASLSQYTGILAFGLTNKIDVSVTVPIERVSLSAGYKSQTQGFISYTAPADNPSQVTALQSAGITSFPNAYDRVAGSASGLGDILINMKGTVLDGEKSKVAVGVEARLPTGNEYNLLGTGSYGVKPYIVFSRLGRITPHVNLGYQWNDFSNLYVNPCYFYVSNPCKGGTGLPTLQLPHSLDYSAGFDFGVVPKLTIVTDFVGQRYFDGPRVTRAIAASGAGIPGIPTSCSGSSATCQQIGNFNQTFGAFQTVGVTNGSFNVDNVALGLKVNPIGHLILSANALIRLDDGGLRPARFIPLVGISYRF
jgi:hypothetical protein